ncbi:ATP-binding cassette sub-family G member 4 [Teleopsis dalmanni]|uniref:ATP-binding cassette sub-family G member 4 n=1 Tax=Teleopsis dalmanni TaxID=139649 RepID=UPI0018CE79FA|nr:ATP-binding cassette sub-family G member 4 [Teleopsis dalmanni]
MSHTNTIYYSFPNVDKEIGSAITTSSSVLSESSDDVIKMDIPRDDIEIAAGTSNIQLTPLSSAAIIFPSTSTSVSPLPTNAIASTAATATIATATATSQKKYSTKKPINLNLKISNKSSATASTTNASSATVESYAETDNASLSNTSSGSNNKTLNNSNNKILNNRNNKTATTPPSTSITMFPHEQNKTIKKIDIGFADIKYSVKAGFFRRENKDILNGLTGEFRNGELSAIVGPSGAGKSTLLNILSAYTPYGYSGDITVNGNFRDIKAFKPNIAFITQDTSLQPFLTVKEAMHFAANLKVGAQMNKSAKRERVRKILEAIGMYENRHTRTGNLSGGQKKRLAIALELVNNPPVLILDEPTSGLDSSTSNQCISLLKKLAMEGRTVICTIHQPSALTFEMFDHLYAIAEGRCIYSGGTENLVPFLAECGLQCPESYNPADYLMEIATDDYGKQNDKLVEKIENGQNDYYRQNKMAKKSQMEAIKKIDKMMASASMTPVTAPVLSPDLTRTPNHNYCKDPSIRVKQLTPINEMSSRIWDSRNQLGENGQITKEQPQPQQSDSNGYKPKKPKLQIDPGKLCKRENIYATPFYRQLSILLVRTFLILWRDQSLTTMRFIIHFVTALLIGFLYYGIGNDAGNALNNFRYAFYTIMFIMFCAFSSILVKFPLEFPIVSREHFNRWYSLRAYYVAITLADIPIQMICTGLFIGTTYFLTDQPFEFLRLGLFSLIVFLTALVGQSIGLTVGASLSVQLGAILGPFFICPFLAFSGFFLQHKDSPIYLQWVFNVSFLKYSLDGAMLALFGYDRPKLDCSSMYCHYTRPKIFLKDMDLANANYEVAVIFLLSLFIGLRILAFYIMSFRLRLFR